MALQCERPSPVVGHQVAFWGFMVILLFVSAAAGESFSRPWTSLKQQIEPGQHGEKLQLKNWVSDYGESTLNALKSQVIRLWSSEEQNWPELKLGTRTITAAILIALAAAVSSAAGGGGGMIYVPLLEAVLLLDSKTAIAMSHFMMFGGATAGMAFALSKNHPTEFNKSLVDFGLALLLQPGMLLGASVGVLLNVMLPTWLITVFLVVILIFMTYSTVKSGLKRWNNETQLAHAKKLARKRSLRRSNTETEKALTQQHLLGLYRSLSSKYPVKGVLALVLVWLTILFVQILRGSQGREGLLPIQECGVSYWLLTACQIPVVVGVTAWNLWQLRAPAAAPTEAGTSDTQDPSQSFIVGPKEGTLLSTMSLLAGLVAGMFGIGGALVINPLLLGLGVLPQVVTATSLFVMFFSSSMSAAQFWLMGRLPVGYALIAALIAAVFSAVGISGVLKVVNKYGRPSLLVFVIAGVLGFNTIFMSIYGSVDAWTQYKSGAYMGFNTPC